MVLNNSSIMAVAQSYWSSYTVVINLIFKRIQNWTDEYVSAVPVPVKRRQTV